MTDERHLSDPGWQAGIGDPDHPEHTDIHARERRTEPLSGHDPVRNLVRDQQEERAFDEGVNRLDLARPRADDR
jgi:hypothetical protein